MIQSIELTFDEPTEHAVRASWSALAAAGLPSLAHHEGATNRPHITLAVAKGGLEPALDAAGAIGDRSQAVVIGAPLLFGGRRQRWVLTRHVVPSLPLLTLHAAVHQAIREHAPGAEVLDQTLPDAWTPHVSLARSIESDRLADALGTIDMEPIVGRVAAMRLWDSGTKTVTAL